MRAVAGAMERAEKDRSTCLVRPWMENRLVFVGNKTLMARYQYVNELSAFLMVTRRIRPKQWRYWKTFKKRWISFICLRFVVVFFCVNYFKWIAMRTFDPTVRCVYSTRIFPCGYFHLWDKLWQAHAQYHRMTCLGHFSFSWKFDVTRNILAATLLIRCR